MKTNTTYREFLNSIPGDSCSYLKEQAPAIVQHFYPARKLASNFAPTSFLLDYATKKYLHVSESCGDLMGYSASYLLETGLEEYLSKWHPDDFAVINKIIFPYNISFLKTVPNQEFPEYIFSYNYRLRNPKNEYVTILQRFSYISGPAAGEIAGVIGVAFDITHYKNDSTIVQTIERCTPSKEGVLNDLVYKKIHPVVGQNRNLLSKRESQILVAISEGLASKQIADRLQVSINTVNNHRRNMLNKTGCKSSSELIRYAAAHGLL